MARTPLGVEARGVDGGPIGPLREAVKPDGPLTADRPTTIVRRLRMAGWSAEEAGNLVAWLAGLPIGRQPWTVREVERLRFVRSMVVAGRLKS